MSFSQIEDVGTSFHPTIHTPEFPAQILIFFPLFWTERLVVGLVQEMFVSRTNTSLDLHSALTDPTDCSVREIDAT